MLETLEIKKKEWFIHILLLYCWISNLNWSYLIWCTNKIWLRDQTKNIPIAMLYKTKQLKGISIWTLLTGLVNYDITNMYIGGPSLRYTISTESLCLYVIPYVCIMYDVIHILAIIMWQNNITSLSLICIFAEHSLSKNKLCIIPCNIKSMVNILKRSLSMSKQNTLHNMLCWY